MVVASPRLPLGFRRPAGPKPVETRLQFTGDGAEYFRIWVVNLLLTLLTLGVYSAWAKVRKTRYFWLNTRLEGFAFDYHGAPGAILKGRILALALFAAYSWAFEFGTTAGLVTIAVLCALGPWLFMKAQSFKLRNTSYRGVRFDFEDEVGAAYRTILPLLLLWFSSTIVSLIASENGALLLLSGLGVTLTYPWMHHTLKDYQHSRAVFGAQQFRFRAALGSFYGVYLRGFLLLLLVGVAISLALGLLVTTLAAGFGLRASSSNWLGTLTGVAYGLCVYTFVWPYMAARLQQVVWERTQWGELRLRNEMRFGALFGVVLRNVVFTLLSLGLYWPFAAVALARYRVESLVLVSKGPLETEAQQAGAPNAGVTGEGAADLFGLDIGL